MELNFDAASFSEASGIAKWDINRNISYEL